MGDEVTVEQVADAMFEMVDETYGKKNIKAGDLTKAMTKKFGVDRKFCKKAIRALIESGRCVYSYFGGSYIIPAGKEEGAAKS